LEDNVLPLPRSVIGTVMEKSSDVINEHLIAARMAIVSSIALLTAFGIANTPLFFRFRTVSEIPRHYFEGRKRLYGRIMSVKHHHHHNNHIKDRHGNGGNNYYTVGPIQVQVRHLSPVGMLLPIPIYDFLLKIHPSYNYRHNSFNTTTTMDPKPKENDKDLLLIQLAGVQSPPVGSLSTQQQQQIQQRNLSDDNNNYHPEHYLEHLAQQRILVSCQLIERRSSGTKKDTPATKRRLSEILPEFAELSTENYNNNSNNQQHGDRRHHHHDTGGHATTTTTTTLGNDIDAVEQKPIVAIAKLYYRPRPFWHHLFSSVDLAEELVETGRANVSSSILPPPCTIVVDNNNNSNNTNNNNTATIAISTTSSPNRIVDSSSLPVEQQNQQQHLSFLRQDVKYLDRLAWLEVDAAKKRVGMWNVAHIRQFKYEEVVQEAEFQLQSNWLQKLWRWMRG
jgi:hypothetical protein